MPNKALERYGSPGAGEPNLSAAAQEMRTIATSAIFGVLFVATVCAQMAPAALSNAPSDKVWLLTDIGTATVRLDLSLSCPWTTNTNRSSWLLRPGLTNDSSSIFTRMQSHGATCGPPNQETITLRYEQKYSTNDILLSVDWRGYCQGIYQRVCKDIRIPICRDSTGEVTYVNYRTQWPIVLGRDATTGVVEQLKYEAVWTTKPRIGHIW